MNIKQAKEQIKNTVQAYLARDEFGDYAIAVERQRPIFLVGAPGIGKTAIMEQIAGELGVGLVAYSMTHHTRQSALGLPFIQHKSFGGREYDVSEYTMSEIIAAVYEQIEESGLQEGILFLDEINCVSETLSPAMLQFLQYKTFGRHRVPEGYVIVTAGNPPEYNDSVREFDVVTLDRLKLIEVEADYAAWKEYALSCGIHGAVISYLDIKKDDFYTVENTPEGKRFATARGWEDLARMITLYEKLQLPVNEALAGQYLQNPRIAKDFAIYYDLYNKYNADYRIEAILQGEADPAILRRAAAARFDERLSLCALLMDAVSARCRAVMRESAALTALHSLLKDAEAELSRPAADVLDKYIAQRSHMAQMGEKTGSLSAEQRHCLKRVIQLLLEFRAQTGQAENTFAAIKPLFAGQTAAQRQQAADTRQALHHMFAFTKQAFGEGRELLILVTELTAGRDTAAFISRYGSEDYFAHSKELLFYTRQQELIAEIEGLEL